MINILTINIPYTLKVEEGIINSIYGFLENYNTKKVLVVSGTGNTKVYGNTILENLLKNEINASIHYVSNNSIDNVKFIADLLMFEEYTLLIGIGGGRVLDVCKYATHMCRTDYISVPTTISHDGIASPIAVISFGDKVRSLGCQVPKGILIDLEIIKNSPLSTKLAGIGDILSNITAIHDWKLASIKTGEKIHDFSLVLSELSVSSILYSNKSDLDEIEFLKELANSLLLSGLAMEISGSSRPCSGSEHLFSHALDLYYPDIDLPHGIKVALGSVISSYMQGNNFNKIKEYLKRFGLPCTPREAGISDEIAVEALLLAKGTRENRYTILNEIEYTKEYFENVITKISD